MDAQPFFIFKLEDLSPHVLSELRKFRAEQFILDSILSSANDLKYLSIIKQIISKEIDHPSEQLVELFARRAYQGRLTAAVREWLTLLVSKAMRETLRDRLNQRLSDAIQIPDYTESSNSKPVEISDQEEIVTTDEEMEGFRVIRAILRNKILAKRVFLRDSKSYCAILIDDNNRKSICRLYFSRKQKRIGIMNGKDETKFDISDLTDIYDHSDALIAALHEIESRSSGSGQ